MRGVKRSKKDDRLPIQNLKDRLKIFGFGYIKELNSPKGDLIFRLNKNRKLFRLHGQSYFSVYTEKQLVESIYNFSRTERFSDSVSFSGYFSVLPNYSSILIYINQEPDFWSNQRFYKLPLELEIMLDRKSVV